MVIRTNSDTLSSDPIPSHIYSIHQSLIQQNIITHPEIITCSQQWINKLEKDISNPSKSNRMKRCHYVNHCLICNHLRKQKILSQMNPYRQIILDNDGRNILLTFTLRHHQSHSFEFLQKILNESIGLLRTSRTFSKKVVPFQTSSLCSDWIWNQLEWRVWIFATLPFANRHNKSNAT